MKELHDGGQSFESKIAIIISAIHAVGSMSKEIACLGIGSVISVGWFSSILIDCVSRSRLRIFGQILLDVLLLNELPSENSVAIGAYALRIANLY